MPQWSLYNGSIGTVEEIIFEKGENPNQGHQPKYVVVHFPSYSGPVWDLNHPKVNTCIKTQTHPHTISQHSQSVPIPLTTITCKFNCCIRKFEPLGLSHGKTIHGYQGETAGPDEEGKPPHSVKKSSSIQETRLLNSNAHHFSTSHS